MSKMALGTIVEEQPPNSVTRLPPPSQNEEIAAVPTEMTYGERISKFIIEARCTDNMLFSGAVVVGGFVLVMQTFPIFMNNWVLLTEPRPINKTTENGEQMESTFHYNTGYFQICRMHINNNSGIIYDEIEIPRSESDYKCYLNPMFSQRDISDFSLASLAVILRLGYPALLHVSGALVCCLAFFLGVLGHVRMSAYTLFSTITYICGSIVLCIAVLMVVCVVDDELAPRMKPNAAGEPSKFSYYYGPPFFSSALSFIPVQICACFHAFLYFRRYPSVVEKLKFVPGLEAKRKRAQLDKELGIPPIESFRRGSLASYLPIPNFSQGSRRNSRRSSQASFSNPSLIFMHDVMLLEDLKNAFFENYVLVIISILLIYVLHIILKPLNRVRLLGDVGLYFGQPERKGIYRERQIERLKMLRRLGELPPVFPNGWYCVCESEKLAPEEIKEITILGQFLTLIRSKSGEVFITESYCPHLGANFNIGGKVVRDKCIQCPFHGWIFNAETGKCVDIPYEDGRIPAQAKVATWPCIERNNNIYIWYHSDGIEPEWEIPEIPEVTSGIWKFGGRTEHEVMCHIQEIPENGADIAHLNYLHKSAPEIPKGSDIIKTNLSNPSPIVQHVWNGKWEIKSDEDKHCGVMHLDQYMTIMGFKVPLTKSKLIAEQHGPGIVHMLFDFGFWGKGVVFQTVTPEEPLLQRVRFRMFSNIPWFFVKFFMTVESMQFERDVYVWSNKKYIKSPLLVRNDGPIQKHRRWFNQFYTETSPKLLKDGSLSNQVKSVFDF
ncbi:unnamed protein product [Caenorhabditis bovis]|uniref:cholesterol 7-desaturase n=1 Tax=Caenorhabditis bovis TaxID=2654633 RepID=A0A8S1EKI2_9PELO|nr:unnamed protein product [Caenorhabditis bovis]